MNEQEKQEIIAEVEASIMEKMKGRVIREDTQAVLSKARHKWFKYSVSKKSADSPMYAVFGTYTYWAVWEMIRKLVCFICGVGYVRNLENKADADEIADKLCQFVYDLRVEQLNQEKLERSTNAEADSITVGSADTGICGCTDKR